MTPDDLAALLRWLYANDDGSGWLPAAAKDLRLNERNLRNMLAGKVAIPDQVADVLAILAAAHNWLNGWQDRRDDYHQLRLALSPRAEARISHWASVLAGGS